MRSISSTSSGGGPPVMPYSPPLSPLPWAVPPSIPVHRDTTKADRRSKRIEPSHLDCELGGHPVIQALVTAAERLAVARGRIRRGGIDRDAVHGAVYQWAGIAGSGHPTSLAAVIDGLALAAGGGGGDRGGDIDLYPLPASRGGGDHGRSRIGIEASSIPRDEDTIRRVIEAGYPVVGGFTVSASALDAERYARGVADPPEWGERSHLGAVFTIEGWDAARSAWLVRHPSDPCWGVDGNGTIGTLQTIVPGWCHELIVITDVYLLEEMNDGSTGPQECGTGRSEVVPESLQFDAVDH